MSLYFWFRSDVEAERELASLKEKGRVGDLRVDTDRETGQQYLAVYEDAFDPTATFPNIPSSIVARVTLKDRIYCGFRTEGIYRHEGAELMVKTHVQVHSEMMADRIEREEWQEVTVSGPNVTAVRNIYTLVRQGNLLPEEDWEAEPSVVSAAQLPKRKKWWWPFGRQSKR